MSIERRLTWLALAVNAVTLAVVFTLWARPVPAPADMPGDVTVQVEAIQAQVDALGKQLARLDSAIGVSGSPHSGIAKTIDDLSLKVLDATGAATGAANASERILTVVQDLQSRVDGLCSRFNAC